MKIGMFSGSTKSEKDKPLVFEKMLLPDGCHILDCSIVFGNHTAQLHLHVVHDTDDKLVPMTLLALNVGQEHDDVREHEFVGKARVRKFTSDVAPMYVFTAPRGE